MSQYTINQGPTELGPPLVAEERMGDIKWVFGWDTPLNTYYIQMHDATVEDEDRRIIHWVGTQGHELYEMEDLLKQARRLGLEIPRGTRFELYQDRDEGR